MKEDDVIDLMVPMKLIFKSFKAMIVVGILMGCVFYGLSFMTEEVFVSKSRWMRSESKNTTQLSGLVALAGLGLGQNTTSEEHFKEYLYSPVFQYGLLDRPIYFGNEKQSLKQYLNINPSEKGKRLEVSSQGKLGKFFRDNVVIEIKKIIELSVSSDNPFFSKEMNELLFRELINYNESIRIKKAEADKKFIESRYEEYKEKLLKAEAEVTTFKSKNKIILDPKLMLKNERLESEVHFMRSLMSDFRRQFELAKVKVVEKKPIYITMEYPSFPRGKKKIKTSILVGMGFVVGVFLCIFAVFVRYWWQVNGKEFVTELKNDKFGNS